MFVYVQIWHLSWFAISNLRINSLDVLALRSSESRSRLGSIPKLEFVNKGYSRFVVSS